MSHFRLFNVDTLATEEFDLDRHPPYIAASHAWIDETFGDREDGFDNCFGGREIRAVIRQAHPDISYCWVDRFCIDQQDKNDKLVQIPLMERIYSQAEVVAIFIKTNIGADQTEGDEVVAGLQGAIEMCREETYEKHGLCWQRGEGRARIVRATRGLQRLAATVWATRVWTMQEFILARSILWVGLEIQPIRLADEILFAMPDACDTLSIQECLNPEMEVIFSHLMGMANIRLGYIDRTRVMKASSQAY